MNTFMNGTMSEAVDEIIDAILDDVEKKSENDAENDCSDEINVVRIPIPFEYQIDPDDSDDLMMAVSEELAKHNGSIGDYHELTNHRNYTYIRRYPWGVLLDSVSIMDDEIEIEYTIFKEEYRAGNFWDSYRISREEYYDLLNGTDIDFYFEEEIEDED